MTAPRQLDVPVAGGSLHVGQWGESGPLVLAVHGITGTHLAWQEVANRLPGVRVVAPDLRGRGRSAVLPGPFGFDAHVEDLVAVLDAVSVGSVVVVGHSMGGFVAVALAARFPARISRLILVDGGLPLGQPTDGPPMDIDAALGPAAARLSMTFPSREAYRDFWRAHPAIGPIWGPSVQAYVDYDLVGEPPGLHSSCRVEAMRANGAEVADHATTTATLGQVSTPMTFLRAERGMLDEVVPLYPLDVIDRALQGGPAVDVATVAGTNHYSIVMGMVGAAAVSAAVTAALPSPTDPE